MGIRVFQTEYRIRHFYKGHPVCCSTEYFFNSEKAAYDKFIKLLDRDDIKELHVAKKRKDGKYEDVTEYFNMKGTVAE